MPEHSVNKPIIISSAKLQLIHRVQLVIQFTAHVKDLAIVDQAYNTEMQKLELVKPTKNIKLIDGILFLQIPLLDPK